MGPEYEDEPREENRLPLRPMYSQLRKHFTKQELMDLSMKLGTLERLTKSVLQFGDEVGYITVLWITAIIYSSVQENLFHG